MRTSAPRIAALTAFGKTRRPGTHDALNVRGLACSRGILTTNVWNMPWVFGASHLSKRQNCQRFQASRAVGVAARNERPSDSALRTLLHKINSTSRDRIREQLVRRSSFSISPPAQRRARKARRAPRQGVGEGGRTSTSTKGAPTLPHSGYKPIAHPSSVFVVTL
jgi:hypothetical protein